jgi:hypothetical protein
MFHWFTYLFNESGPIEFVSSFSISDSVDRLRAATVPSVFLSLGKQSAVGTVREHRVSLQRVIPFVGNSFKPFFRGRFEMKDGRVVLLGRFTTLWFVKPIAIIWLGMCAVFAMILLVNFVIRQGPFPLFNLAILLISITLIWFSKWSCRNDIAWLSNVIERALSADADRQPFGATADQ